MAALRLITKATASPIESNQSTNITLWYDQVVFLHSRNPKQWEEVQERSERTICTRQHSSHWAQFIELPTLTKIRKLPQQ